MAIDEILISVSPGETRAALRGAGRLKRVVIDRGDEVVRPGDIHVGRVRKVMAGIDAAFVDVGLERDGFLAVAEARPPGEGGGRIGAFLSEGDPVLVQVLRAPEGGKGAKLTTRISLPGRFLVFLAGDPVVRLSRRVNDPEAHMRIESLAETLPRDSGGWIVRAAALSADEAAVAAERDALLDVWAAVTAGARNAKPPCRLRRGPEPVLAAICDAAALGAVRVVVDSRATAVRLGRFLSEAASVTELYGGPGDLFASFGVDEQIEAALRPRVALPSGGAVTIVETPAVVAVDVDTGALDAGRREDTAFSVNLEAVETIAEQLRLRDLGGHVVVDFVPMRKRARSGQILAALREAVTAEGRRVNVAGFTRFGLVEITRQRWGPSLAERLCGQCPACAGEGLVRSPVTVALAALRSVLAEDRARPGAAWAIRAAPAVADALRGPARDALGETEALLGRPLIVDADPALAPEATSIGPKDA